MRIALYTTVISPHMLPLASALARLVGEHNFVYVYTKPIRSERINMGWDDFDMPEWIRPNLHLSDWETISGELLNTDLLIFTLFDNHIYKMLKTCKRSLYISERWFKPPIGMLRLAHPIFLFKALKKLFYLKRMKILYLPIGIHAAVDLARFCELIWGNLLMLFSLPDIRVENRVPFARFLVAKEGAQKETEENCKRPWWIDQMRLWGYFIDIADDTAQSDSAMNKCMDDCKDDKTLKIFWCGRMLEWKHLDTVINSVKELSEEDVPVSLHVVGNGAEEDYIKAMASELCDNGTITFYDSVPMRQIRAFMRSCDVYILASDGYEGWGVVVNEAMAEGCCVIASYESGSSVMISPGVNGYTFPSCDSKRLTEILLEIALDKNISCKLGEKAKDDIRQIWNPDYAAKKIVQFCEENII